MTYNSKKHIWYYAGLVIVLSISFLLILQTSYDKNIQMGIGLIMAFFYVGWALLHHVVHHDIHIKIVLEYVLFGVLGISILYFTLYLL